MTNMKNSEKPFRPVLDFGSRSLAWCLNQVTAQQVLLGIVKSALPTALAEHAVHCVASGSQLLLYCDSASWASQIRFFNRAILDKLHGAGHPYIVRLQVRIVPPIAESVQPKRVPCLPSVENIGLICDQAQRGDELDVLGAALARLGATLNKRLMEGR
ncbi:DciA family protein [Methylomonas sp. MK1]|uniref:DciA family protein n=1 Tax=Methylomonas sp. MK1 TaxID=1131552 RepID=UPI000369398E|nr:DciA family protein [Methylomonas sp. MK1]